MAVNTPVLADRNESVLLVIDVQEKLLPAINAGDTLIPLIGLLLEAAKATGVPILVTEQYPQGLGPTVEAIRRDLPPGVRPIPKAAFSCVPEPEFASALAALNRSQVVVCGIETHVCVAQTALELSAGGRTVFLAADATGSRRAFDRDVAINRLRRSGIVVTSSEAVAFEWLRVAGTPEFKAVQRRLKTIP